MRVHHLCDLAVPHGHGGKPSRYAALPWPYMCSLQVDCSTTIPCDKGMKCCRYKTSDGNDDKGVCISDSSTCCEDISASSCANVFYSPPHLFSPHVHYLRMPSVANGAQPTGAARKSVACIRKRARTALEGLRLLCWRLQFS